MGNQVSRCYDNCIRRRRKPSREPNKLELISRASPESVPLSMGEKSFESPQSTLELETFHHEKPTQPYDPGTILEALNHACGCVVETVEDDRLELLVDKDQVRVTGKVSDRGYFLRTEWVTMVSKERFMEFVRRYDHRPSWDTNLAESRILTSLPQHISIAYQRFKKVLTVSPRDLILACKSYSLQQGLLEVTTSVETSECPAKENVIRATVFMGGFWAETTEKGSTRVVAVTEVNFGGAIPKAVMLRMSASAMPRYVTNLNHALIQDTSL